MSGVQRPVGPEDFEELSRRLDTAGGQAGRAGKALYENLLMAQQEVMEYILQGPRLGEVLDRLEIALSRVFAPARCTVSLFDATAGRLCPHPTSRRREELDPESELLAGPAAGPIEAALAQGAPIVIADFRHHSGWPVYGAKALVRGLRSCWVEPVVGCGEHLAAAVALFHHEPGEPNATDERAMKAAASVVAFAIRATEREQALRLDNERFASVTAALPGVVYQRLVTPDGQIRYTYISEGARELFGLSPDEILSNPGALFSRHGADYSAKFRERLLAASKTLSLWDVEATIVTPDGRKKYTHAIARPQAQTDGSVLWTGLILDETRTREAFIESLSEGFLLYGADDLLILKNNHFIDIYPTLADVAVPGAAYEAIVRGEFASILDLPLDQVQATPDYRRRIEQHGQAHSVSEHRLKDRWILVNEHRTSDGGTVVHYTDITELKRREQQIQHLAFHDALTGLPNRLLFHERIEEALADAQARSEAVAVMCLDLDHFKNVNDSLGHGAGDELLRVIGERLRECVREGDTVARLGGDEFGIVLANLGDADIATILAWRIISALNQPVDLHGHQAIVGTSIGIATSTSDGVDADALLKNADLALYRAKADGRGTFRFFEADMDARAQARRALENDLRQAVAKGELEVHYQPQVHLETNAVVGFEALVRWRHPQRGLVPPEQFIPLAEETGIIMQIGQWVLRQACMDARQWPDGTNVAVNVSPAQFRNHDLAQQVAAILAETGLPPNRLEIEITESLLLRDANAKLGTLDELRRLGLRVSMDDFGTGYSSLSNLRSFPFDKIKIDRSFVKELNRSPDSAAIVRAVLGLGRSLGISTCAEGVETAEQIAALREQGCTEVQGFFFSTPKPFGELAPLLSANPPRQG